MEAVPFQILSIALSSFFFSLSRQKWYLYNKVQEDYTLHILSQTSQLKCVKIQIAGGGMWALYMGNVCVVYKEMQFVPKCSFSPPPTNQAEQTCKRLRSLDLLLSGRQFDCNSLINSITWPTYTVQPTKKSRKGLTVQW